MFYLVKKFLISFCGLLLIFSTTSTFSKNLNNNIPPNPIIAAGSYHNGGSVYPLISNSQDGGLTWILGVSSSNPILPADFTEGSFLSSSYSEGSSIAVGFYNIESFVQYPLLAYSRDRGINWEYSIDKYSPKLPSDFISGFFYGASCSKLNCIAAGGYENNHGNFPLLAHSRDGGINWTYVIDSNTPALPYNFQGGQFYGASCSNFSCIAFGNQISIPLLASSNDGGASWTYPSYEEPRDFKSGSFTTGACTRENCVVAGSYNDGEHQYPLMVYSKDGQKWALSIAGFSPLLPADYDDYGHFSSLSCSKSHCVAVGDYLKNTEQHNITYPLVANSQDGGRTWNYSNVSTISSFPADYYSGNFLKVSCSKLNCVAVGYYYDSQIRYYPLAATSKDGGLTWNYTINSSSPFTSAQFTDVSCSRLNCIIIGTYPKENGFKKTDRWVIPVVAKSFDGGSTWTYLSQSELALPNDFAGGSYSSIEMYSSLLKNLLS